MLTSHYNLNSQIMCLLIAHNLCNCLETVLFIQLYQKTCILEISYNNTTIINNQLGVACRVLLQNYIEEKIEEIYVIIKKMRTTIKYNDNTLTTTQQEQQSFYYRLNNNY